MFNSKLHLIDLYLKMQLNGVVKNALDNALRRGEAYNIWEIVKGNFQSKRSWLIMSIGNSYRDVFFREEDIGAYIDFYFNVNFENIIHTHWKKLSSDGTIYSDRENMLDEVVITVKKKERTPGFKFNLGGNYSFFVVKMFLALDRRLKTHGSGDRMWGTGGGTQEFGRKATEHGEIYGSQYMDEWVIPGGGGGKLSFLKNKSNFGSWTLKSLRDINSALEHGENVSRIIAVPKNETETNTIQAVRYHLLIDEKGNKSVIDTLRVNIHLEGTILENKKRRDSVKSANSNMDLSTEYWLKN